MAENSKEKESVDLVKSLIKESSESRKSRTVHKGKSIVDWWEIGLQRWVGDHWEKGPKRGLVQMTVNRDQVAIAQNVADQTVNPIAVKFLPMEVDEAPIYFVSARAISGLVEMKNQEAKEKALAAASEKDGEPAKGFLDAFSMEEVTGQVPLSYNKAMTLKELGKDQIDPTTGQRKPALLDPRTVVEVSDSLRAEVIQRVFQAKWKSANGDAQARELELYSNIFGHSVLWGQIDPSDWSFRFSSIHPLHALPDSLKSDIAQFDYVVLIEPISDTKLKHMYPKLSKRIDDYTGENEISGSASNTSSSGQKEGGSSLFKPVAASWEPSSVYKNHEYQRKMFSIVTAYIRDHDYPMDAEKAVTAGHLEKTEAGLIAVRTGEVVTPDDHDWPKRKGIRQIQIIQELGEQVVDDESDYYDFPVAWNKNLPLLFSPYGMSESWRTYDVQSSVNHIATAIVNQLLYSGYPQQYWPKSLLDALPKGVTPHAHPGKVIGVPDAQWQDFFARGLRRGFMLEAPEIPSDLIRVWVDFRQEHELLSGHTGRRT